MGTRRVRRLSRRTNLELDACSNELELDESMIPTTGNPSASESGGVYGGSDPELRGFSEASDAAALTRGVVLVPATVLGVVETLH